MCGLLSYEGAVGHGCKDLETGEREFRRERWERIAEVQEVQRSKGLKAGEQLCKERRDARCECLVLWRRERDMD